MLNYFANIIYLMRFRINNLSQYLIIFFTILTILTMIIVISNRKKEGFTTKLGHIYRPYIRKARIFSENFLNNTTGSVSTFFRKIGLA